MIMVRISIHALPEKQKEVRQTLLSLVASLTKEKGCLSYGIFADIRDDNIFNAISEWETRQHLDRHLQSDGFSVLIGTKSLLREPVRIRIFTVASVEGTAAVNLARKKN